MRRKTIIDSIRENDPEFDPLTYACASTGIPRETVNLAYSMVYWDGYHGPLSHADWCEEDPSDARRAALTVPLALGILARIGDAVDDYRETDLEFCDHEECGGGECEGHEAETGRIDSSDIVDALFPAVREIYGSRIGALDVPPTAEINAFLVAA